MWLDNEGAASADTVVVTVNPKDTGPVIYRSSSSSYRPLEVNAGDEAVVDASASSDADQDIDLHGGCTAGIDATVPRFFSVLWRNTRKTRYWILCDSEWWYRDISRGYFSESSQEKPQAAVRVLTLGIQVRFYTGGDQGDSR